MIKAIITPENRPSRTIEAQRMEEVVAEIDKELGAEEVSVDIFEDDVLTHRRHYRTEGLRMTMYHREQFVYAPKEETPKDKRFFLVVIAQESNWMLAIAILLLILFQGSIVLFVFLTGERKFYCLLISIGLGILSYSCIRIAAIIGPNHN